MFFRFHRLASGLEVDEHSSFSQLSVQCVWQHQVVRRHREAKPGRSAVAHSLNRKKWLDYLITLDDTDRKMLEGTVQSTPT